MVGRSVTEHKYNLKTETINMLPTVPWMSIGGGDAMAPVNCTSLDKKSASEIDTAQSTSTNSQSVSGASMVLTNTLTDMMIATQTGTNWFAFKAGASSMDLKVNADAAATFGAAKHISTDGAMMASAIWSVRPLCGLVDWRTDVI